MARMIRKQVYIEARQEEVLKEAAGRLGTSEAELIRQAIDELDSPRNRTVADREAWTTALSVMWQRAARAEPASKAPSNRGWTRDELYDDRPKYLVR